MRWKSIVPLVVFLAIGVSGISPLMAQTGGKSDRKSSAASATAEGEWPGWLGPNRDGKSPDKGLLKEWPAGGPKLLWKATDIGQGYSSVAVSKGIVYVTGDVEKSVMIHAYDLDGKPKWKAAGGPAWTGASPGARSTPTIDGNNLYLLCGSGQLGCFDARTGKRHWSKEAKEFGGAHNTWGYTESVLIQGNMAIFKPGGKNCLVALDKLTGHPIWSSQGFTAGPDYGSCLAITSEKVPMIVAGTHDGIFSVNARTGALLWSNKFAEGNTANCNTAAFSDDHVFWANGYGKGGICLKLETGGKASEAWTTRDMDCQHGGYIIDNGYIFGNNGGGWTCLDLRTGKKQWTEHAVGKGSLCWADDMLYLFSEGQGNAALATCSPEGLQIKGRVKVNGEGPSWAHPVVIGGRLYLRYDTTLYCFDVRGSQ